MNKNNLSDAAKIEKIDSSIKKLSEAKNKGIWKPNIPNLKLKPKVEEELTLRDYDLVCLNKYPTIKDKTLSDKNFWVYLNLVYAKTDIFYTDFDIDPYIIVLENKRGKHKFSYTPNILFTDIMEMSDICFNAIKGMPLTVVMNEYNTIIIKYIIGNVNGETQNTLFRVYESAKIKGAKVKVVVNSIHKDMFNVIFSDFIKTHTSDDLTEPSPYEKLPKRDLSFKPQINIVSNGLDNF